MHKDTRFLEENGIFTAVTNTHTKIYHPHTKKEKKKIHTHTHLQRTYLSSDACGFCESTFRIKSALYMIWVQHISV